jgi:iron(III) transport system substrate-binding protein
MSTMRLSRCVLVLLLLSSSPVKAAESLMIYSAQKEPYIRPLLDRYTAETGVEFEFLNDQGPVLIERLAAEGADTRADVLITVDAGNLWTAAERGLLAPIDSDVLEANVPAALRDTGGRWFGLSRRARTIVYASERVAPAELDGYGGLADAKWKGRLCLRTSRNVYNQSLVATRIAHLGEAEAERLVRGWVANLALTPLPDDTLTVKAIAAGECDVGVVNMYYLARLKREDANLPVAVHWADQGGRGVHVNVCGAGVSAHSRQKAAAQRFLEWLSSASVQREIARLNLEYPVNAEAAADPLLAAWGEFTADALPLTEAGRLQPDAVRLMDRAGWR